MVAFHRAGRERLNVFPIEGEYRFRHYVEDDAFAELKRYYRRYEYRFQVPPDRLPEVRSVLERHGYDPVVVDDVEAYAVVKRKYSNHPKVLFSASVLYRSVDRFNCFVLKDRESVEAAVRGGATSLSDTTLDVQL